MMASTQSYKKLHEEFVSNLSGTTIWEIQGIATIAVICSLLRDVTLLKWPMLQQSTWLKFAMEFSLLVLPVQLCLTVFSDHWSGLLLGLLGLTFTLCISLVMEGQKGSKSQKDSHSRIHKESLLGNKKISNILQTEVKQPNAMMTNMRSSLLVSTALAILAVDFPVFPRRFGKAETYGSGLMDGGVGMFTAFMGMVAKEARSHPQALSFSRRLSQLWDVLWSSCPLLVLGVVRLLMVKSSGYQEHVTEYGVHWNFFFTLTAVRIFCTLLLLLWTPSFSWLLAVVLAGLYQLMLSHGGLTQSLLLGFYKDGQRHGFIDSNREGIVSCLGYVSIYLAGVFMGQLFFLPPRKTVQHWLAFVGQLLLAFLVFNVLLSVSQYLVDPISRRFANLSYILWVMSMLLQMVGLFITAELVFIMIHCLQNGQVKGEGTLRSRSQSSLMSDVNYNGLAYFAFSNLFTGLINKSVQTIYASSALSSFIIALYMLTLSFLMNFLYVKKIRLKF